MERIFGKIKRLTRKLDGKCITAKVMSAVLIASTVLNAVVPAMAYAAEPKLATVSLAETEHGKLSFDGGDDMSMAVEVGTDVTVKVTPDEGYFADSLTVFTGDEDGAAVDVKDGEATFTVEGDTIVTSTFYQNGTVGSAALKPVDVDEGKSVASVEDYVRDHADPQYVGKGDDLTRADVLTVTTTVVDGSKLADATLDKLWEDTDGDDMADNYTAMLSQAVSHAVLFEVDPGSDYYVGWAGADIDGAKLTDWAAAENNADAQMRDGFIVDEDTGLVYVPKSYTETNADGEPMVASSRIQLVYTVQDASATATFDFSTSATDASADGIDEGKASLPISSAYSRITLSADDGTPVDGNLIDSVTVNGIEYTSDMNMWSYDSENGTLEFFMAPSGIHCMTVNMSGNLIKSAASLLGISTYSSGVNNIGTWEFEDAPTAGFKFKVEASNTYGLTHSSGGILPAIENPSLGNYENKTIYQALGTRSVDVSALVSGNYSILRSTTIHKQTTSEGVTIPGTEKLGLTCGHVGVNQNFKLDDGYNDPSGSWTDELGAQVNIVAVYGDSAIIGVVVPTANTQAGGGFFEINWRVVAGKLNLHKSSANPSITDGNDCYSLEGAEFTVYNAANQSVGVLRTNANGDTNTLELPEGTYTVRETKAPAGYLPAADQTVTVRGGQTTTAQVSDQPSGDPMVMVVGKYDGDKEYSELEGNMPQGSASLEGAEFTIEYYDTVAYDSYDSIKQANVEPTRTWVVRTDKDGYAELSGNYFVSGDEIYHDASGNITIPRGSVAVYESKAPEGYKLNKEVNFQKIQENPLEGVTTFNLPEIPESVIRGGVKITKHDIENGTSDPIGAASIDGTQFEVKSLNENPVIADGVTYNKGQVITTLTIKDGEASTANDLLPYGLYSIQEVKSGEGYLLTDGKAHEFRIEKDGELVNPINGSFENQVMRSDLEFTKKGDDGSDRLAGIAFKVTSKTTGESHVAVTDENGYFSSASSWNKHTQDTNGNDWALDADGVIDSDELDATAGIWFGGTEPDDSKGALPYDTYSIEELRCTANEGYQLVETTVIISRDGKVYDFGTLTDVKASITTKAFDPQDGDSLVGMGYVHIADKVNYSNLISGRDYKLVAELHDASTGDILTDESGEAIVTEQSFTANEPTGFEYVDFQLSTYDLGGKTVTVYEKLYDDNNSLIAEHTDKDDVNQQVSVVVPEIGTVAVDGADGDKDVSTDDEATVNDTVSYKNLVPGKQYLVLGQLFEKKSDEDGETTGEPLEVDGKPVTGYVIFTPESANGTVDVTYTFDSLALKDDTQLVVYEALFGYDKPMSADAISKMVPFNEDGTSKIVAEPEYPLLAEHADINDLGQTVTIRNPHITTTALDGVDMNKNVVADDESVIIDTVSYENLVPGKEYTLKGSVQVKKTGEDGKVSAEPLEVDGKPVKAETTFTPEKSEGTANVTFQFSSRDLNPGTELVVFESLERDGNVLVTHDSIEDVNQTVTIIVPSIATTALDGTDADKNVVTDDESVIVDTVEYKNLVPGKEYVAKGQLYLKDTGKQLEVDGKPVKAETTFTPDTADGKVDVTFTFDSRTIEDKTDLVVFESLERCGSEIASHKDIEDDKQTVTVTHPEIGTSAVDGSDGDRNVIVDDTTEVIDTVEYTGLIPGKEYTVKGTLHVKVTDDEGKVTDEVLKVDGKPVTAETTFTPEKADGKVDVTFIFDSRTIPHDTEIVAFESLERNGVEIAVHADIEDKSQTVTAKHPFITTSALDGHDSDKNVVTDAETTIIDTVKYSGLIPGKEYTMKGSMQVKKTGEDGKVTAEPLEVDGKPVTAETTFTPDTTDGKVDVTFTFDSSSVEDKTDLVVFESLERGGVSIAEHKDIEDEKQTTTSRVTGISTTATDELDGDKTVIADAETTITDDVAYENALTGIDYTMAGILMDADTGLPILTGDGSEKYTENDVAKFMQKLLDVLGIASTNEGGKDYLDVPVSQNTADGVTKSQSVRVHVDGTYEVVTSENGMDGDGLGYANVDTSGSIGYDKLTDEQKAAISNVAVLPEAGIILDYTGADNLPADIDTEALDQLIADNSDLISHLVFQKAEFTPDKYDGTVPMDFHFNANDVIDRLGGETKDIVVFEVMFKNGSEGAAPVIVASECDLDCDEQTVNLVPSVISTTATDKSDGDHTLMAGKDAVITDRVAYEGLIPGKEYTLKATLMDKETGEMLSINDQHVTAELKFTPNSQSGTVDIDLGKFDASSLDGHDLVVFEELYKQTTDGDESTDVLVAEHKDIEDEAQTVTVTTTPPGGFFGKTGGNAYFVVLAIAALVVLAGGCAYYGIKSRRAAKSEDSADGKETGNGDASDKPEA